MKIAFYLNCISAHQLPISREVVRLVGPENFRYIDAGLGGQSLQSVGHVESWITTDKTWLETADLVLTGLRDFDSIERRVARGLKTYYYSERWFKPIPVGEGLRRLIGLRRANILTELYLPGWARMVVPGYRRMVKRFVKWANDDPRARVLAIGPWAKKDFLRMGVKAEKIVDWGYFVEPSSFPPPPPRSSTSRSVLRVLWAGRDIPLKHVRDIERAVALANKNLTSNVDLHLFSPPISFTKLTGVTPAEVRKAMREHDTLVFASNGYEGWGAVVSEALEEGMNAIGTWECGAPPTLLPKERLYHCGDVCALAELLRREWQVVSGQCVDALPECSIGEWTAAVAAKRLLSGVL